MQIAELVEVLSRWEFPISRVEVELHAHLQSVLQAEQVEFEREVRLGDSDRIDFLLADGLGIEVKVEGSLSSLIEQACRYAQHDQIKQLLVVTTRRKLALQSREINGKPVQTYVVSGV